LAGFTFFLSNNVVNPAIPIFLKQIGGTEGQIGIAWASMTVAALVTRPFAGAIIDRGYLRYLLAFGGLNSAISGISYTFIGVVWQMYILRAFKGLGLTAFSTSAGTAVADIAPLKRRGEAVGIWGLTGPLAQTIGPALGIAVLGIAGFNWLFAVSCFLGLMSLALAFQTKIPKKERPAGGPAPFKLINKDALFPSLIMATTSYPMGPLTAFIPLYITQEGRGGLEGLALYSAIHALSMTFIRLATGRLTDIYGRAVVFVPGMLVMAAGIFYLTTNVDYVGLLVAGAIMGCGFGAAQPALMALTIDRVRPSERGSALATSGAAFDGGVTVGSLAGGFILEQAGFGAMFASVAIVPVVGVIAYLVFNRRFGRSQQQTAVSH
jgi:MFS family permease